MSTGIAPYIALPHANIPQIKKAIGVLGVSLRGIDYEALDGKPVHIVMMIIGNSEAPLDHLKVLKNIASLIANPDFFPSILKCKTPKDIVDHIVDFEDLSKFKDS
jgi:PTS system fructose-specific IIC component/PTS system nitrogen regulatory IIA component